VLSKKLVNGAELCSQTNCVATRNLSVSFRKREKRALSYLRPAIRIYQLSACFASCPGSAAVLKDGHVVEDEILATVQLENFFCRAKIAIFAAYDRYHTTDGHR
jgi:hypothetical protein